MASPPDREGAGARDLGRIVAAATLSNFGSMLTRLALPLVAVDALHASAAQMSGLNAARLVPALSVGLFAAAWLDRRRKRGVLIATDLLHAGLLAAVPLLFALGGLSMPLLWGFAFLSGLLSLVFGIARQSFVPSLVSRAALLEANARITAGTSAAEALAFGAGGWLVQWLSAPLALLVDALSYLASAGLIAGVRSPESEPSPGRREARLERIRAGARAIRADAQLIGLLALGMAAALASEALGVVYFLFVRRELGFAPGLLGVLFAVGSLASVGASLVAGRVNAALGERGAIGAGLLVGGLATLALAGAPGATLLGAAAILCQQLGDAGLTIFEVQALSQRQAAAPPELQGRVHGAFSFVGSWAMFAGALLGGALGEAIGTRATIAGAAALQVAAALAWLAFAPRGRPA